MKNRKLTLLYIITAAIFITAAVFSLIILTYRPTQTVEILQDEKVLYIIDLTAAQNQTITIDCEDGSNTVEILDGRIRVKEADCADSTCVKMSWLDGGAPIVCLPHRLVIRFVENSDVDAVVR